MTFFDNYHPKKALAMTLLASAMMVLLSGCGASDDRKEAAFPPHDHDHSHDHDHGHGTDDSVTAEISNGRLLIAEKGSNHAYVYSLAQQKVIQTLTLAANADALQTSPEGNYALVLDRSQQLVNFYHSGLEIEDHGDHNHPYARDVSKMPLQLSYPRPVHYQVFGSQAGLFFDGIGAAGNPIANPKQSAGFALVTDADIAKGKLAYQALNTNMHGSSEPRGDYMISTGRYDTVGSPLADTVAVFERHNDHYHLTQQFSEKCSGLHGSSSTADHTVFACSDGLLKVTQSQNTFSAEKLPYPVSLSQTQCKRDDGSLGAARIGSFAKNPDRQSLVGTACGQPYHIDPARKAITPIIWSTDASRQVLSYDFDTSGKTLMLLDSLGELHLLDVAQNYKELAKIALFAKGLENTGHGGPSLIQSPNTNHVYIMDSDGKQIFDIDLTTKSLAETLKLGFTPSQMTWFGLKTKKS